MPRATFVRRSRRRIRLDGQPYAGGTDVALIKSRPDGSREWTRSLGTTGTERAYGVAVDADERVDVTGYTTGDLDSDGRQVWLRQAGSTGEDKGIAVAVSGGAVYAAGMTAGDLGTSAGGVDGFVTRYSSAGEPVWMKQLGTPASDEAWGLTADPAGGGLPDRLHRGRLLRFTVRRQGLPRRPRRCRRRTHLAGPIRYAGERQGRRDRSRPRGRPVRRGLHRWSFGNPTRKVRRRPHQVLPRPLPNLDPPLRHSRRRRRRPLRRSEPLPHDNADPGPPPPASPTPTSSTPPSPRQARTRPHKRWWAPRPRSGRASHGRTAT